MAWKNNTTMDQKVEFICEWMSERYTLTELCEFYEISRPTGYQLIRRYEQHGIKGLTEQSRAPFHHPNSTQPEVVDKILNLKEAHTRWGAKKLRALLYNDFSDEEIPSVLTVHNILKKNGLVYPQKRRRRVKPVYPIFDPQECNQVWSADYKGKFRMRNSQYCHPLTIADSRSRFLFTARAHLHEDYESVKGEFTRVFRKY
ncbi:MAG: helix-turn-helix domain-containing protein, partial [Bacteroidales bacterium]